MITIKLVSTKNLEKFIFTIFTNFFREIAALGSKMAGQKPQLFDIVLHCLFVMPDYLPVEKRFDVQVSCKKTRNFVKIFREIIDFTLKFNPDNFLISREINKDYFRPFETG